MRKEMADNRMDDMLMPREVARLLHIHPNTLRRWSDQGLIKAYRIGLRGDRRFRRADIASFLVEFNPRKPIERKV